ncbi:MAG: ABC transporter permease [Bdellovibrionaceae bacterium]|nr:ABC transporter permease [Pseudobdellovibrionaceae bacterium]NUM57647.1 ABC transporter permease [Pseudobdellovibrionaceae bacterium]
MNFNTQKAFLKFTTVLITTAGLSLILGFFVFFKNLNRVITVWGDVEKVTAYLNSDVALDEVQEARRKIEALDHVKKVTFVTKEQAVEEFKTQVAGFLHDVKEEGSLVQLMPSYFEIEVKVNGTFDETLVAIKKMASTLEEMKVIEEVSYGSLWLDKYSQFIEYIYSFSGVIGMILVVTVFLVISNLIKSNIYQRAREIEILEIIGATKSYIRKPFLIEGLFIGLVSGIISLVLIFSLFRFFNVKFEKQISFFRIQDIFSFLSTWEIIAFMLFTSTIGLISSYINIVRFKWNSGQ